MNKTMGTYMISNTATTTVEKRLLKVSVPVGIRKILSELNGTYSCVNQTKKAV